MKALANRMWVPRLYSTAATVMLLAAETCIAAAAASPPAAPVVLVEDFAFQPEEVTVPVGGGVTWVIGSDPDQHTVSPRDPDAFDDSGQLFSGDRFMAQFRRPGTVQYFCRLHPLMAGTVNVVAPGSPEPTAVAVPSAGSPRATAVVSPAPRTSSPGTNPGDTVNESGSSSFPFVLVGGLAAIATLVLVVLIARRRL